MKYPKSLIAKNLGHFLKEGRLSVGTQMFAERFGSDGAAQFVQEAKFHGFITHDNRIQTSWGAGNYIKIMIEARYEKGQKIVMVKNGKSYSGLVADDKNGQYKLAFIGDSPDGDDKEKLYSDLDFGTLEDEDEV